ncbi:MAG: preprotein translocase subunit YajC [Clostridiales bacterium]|nr:preprotein translocase subunit YajC [Clostridiales bacterium]
MGGSAMTWISCILILVIFWLILIRPQKKKEKQIQNMRKGVKAGDKIITIGGMKARVIKDKEDSLIIEVGEKVRMEVMRWAVSSVVEQGKGSVRKTAEKQIEEAAKEEAEDIVAKAEAAVEEERAVEAEAAVEAVEEENK